MLKGKKMSEAEASRFMNDLKEKPELINEMKPYRENPSEAYAHVRELGYDATTEEIRDAYLEFVSTAISEDQLTEVVAGLSTGAKAGIIAASTVGGAAIGAAAVGTAVMIAGVVACGSAAAL